MKEKGHYSMTIFLLTIGTLVCFSVMCLIAAILTAAELWGDAFHAVQEFTNSKMIRLAVFLYRFKHPTWTDKQIRAEYWG